MAADSDKSPKRNPALLSGEYGSALPLMVPHDSSIDPDEDSAEPSNHALPEISRSSDDLTPSAADLPDAEDSFEEESFWQEMSADGEDEEARDTIEDGAAETDPLETVDREEPAAAPAEPAAGAVLPGPIEQSLNPEPPEEPAAPEASAAPAPAFDRTPASFDPLEESTPWIRPGRSRGLIVAVAAVAVLALGIGGWFVHLGISRAEQNGGDPAAVAHASGATGGMNATMLPVFPTKAGAKTLGPAAEPVVAPEPAVEREAAPAEPAAEPEPAAPAPAPDDGLAEALPAGPSIAPVEGDPWAAPAVADDAPRAVELHHAPIEQVVVGDKVLVRTTTPGVEDCEVHLYWHRPGEALQQHALYRSGASHSLVLTVGPEMGPVFEYFLVATGCGAAVWPADGSTRSVVVR